MCMLTKGISVRTASCTHITLDLHIIDNLESFKETINENSTLVSKVWKVFVTLRDKLIHQLLRLKMHSMLPNNSIELVITCLYEKHVKGKDLVAVELFAQEFCNVLDKLDINNVFECITSKNQLSRNERICTFYALYQHCSSINPMTVVIDEWKSGLQKSGQMKDCSWCHPWKHKKS